MYPPKIRKHIGYQVIDPKNAKDLYRNFYNLTLAVMNKDDLGGQVDYYEKMCLEILDDDKTCKTLAIANKLKLPGVRFFAWVRNTKNPRVKTGDSHFWSFRPANTYHRPIPADAMENLTKLKMNGVKFDDLYVGELKEIRTKRPDPDPVLVGSFGRFMIEIGRWE